MRRNVDYLTRVAHGSYLDGLKQTGISIDHIPNMYGMNRILKEIGWAAVAVDGFRGIGQAVRFEEFFKILALLVIHDVIHKAVYDFMIQCRHIHTAYITIDSDHWRQTC